MVKRNKKSRSYVWIIFSLVILVALVFYFKGYRFDKDNFISSPGEVELSVPFSGAIVYLDNVKEKTTDSEGQKINLSALRPGVHTILISKEGFWPWKKDITILSGAKIKLNSFLVSKTVTGSAITGADPEYESILDMVRKNVFSEDKKLMSSDNLIKISLENNTIFAEWLQTKESIPYYFCSESDLGNCENKLKILSPKDKIINIDFYKGNSDLLLIAMGESISVLELNPKGTQNFQPIYKGKEPSFVKNPSSNSIFVSDGNSLMEINL